MRSLPWVVSSTGTRYNTLRPGLGCTTVVSCCVALTAVAGHQRASPPTHTHVHAYYSGVHAYVAAHQWVHVIASAAPWFCPQRRTDGTVDRAFRVYCAMPVLATSGNRYTLRNCTNALLTGGRGSLGAGVHPWAQGRAGALWRRPRAFLGSLGVGERRLVRGLRRSGPGGGTGGGGYPRSSAPVTGHRPLTAS